MALITYEQYQEEKAFRCPHCWRRVREIRPQFHCFKEPLYRAMDGEMVCWECHQFDRSERVLIRGRMGLPMGAVGRNGRYYEELR